MTNDGQDSLLWTFKALSDGTRLRILKLLEAGELCVCDLVAALNESQPKISFHLNILKRAGFIGQRRQGKWSYYKIDAPDMLNRMLLLSIHERANDMIYKTDIERLNEFRKSASAGGSCVTPANKKKGSCDNGD